MDSRIPEVLVKMAHVQTQRFKSCNELRLDNETKNFRFCLMFQNKRDHRWRQPLNRDIHHLARVEARVKSSVACVSR